MCTPEASLLQARSLFERGIYEQGWHLLQQALHQYPDHAGLHNLAGALLQTSGQLHNALQHLQHAVQEQPDLTDAWHNLALLHHQLSRIDDARRCYREALQLDPDNAQLHFNLSFTEEQAGEFEAATASLRRALEIDSGHLESRYRLMYLKRFACDWSDLQSETDSLARAVLDHIDEQGSARLSPYGLNIHRVSGQCHDACAGYFAEQIAGAVRPLAAGCKKPDQDNKRPEPQDGRIRLAYISADFCSHAVGGLVHRLFEHHDRDKFHVTAYALSQQDDAVNQVIRSGVDVYREVTSPDPMQAYNVIAGDNIDILVDLGGYTKGARPEILALRAAPVQISWLGYLNTMRADFVDYLIADDVVVPLGDEDQYTESVIRLPACFLPASEFPADESPGRADLGLPQHATVFCSFNHSYKIEPDAFRAWMRILAETPNSVLWVYAGANNLAEKNLSSAAESSGVNPERLVFASRVPLSEHLARLPAADLFLDTIYYSAGATAIATIQAGVPILTMQSGRILGRMGASVNRALGLDELTCSNIDDYVAKAIALAKNPDQGMELKKRIDDARPALFDLQRFAKKLETAFEETLERLPR